MEDDYKGQATPVTGLFKSISNGLNDKPSFLKDSFYSGRFDMYISYVFYQGFSITFSFALLFKGIEKLIDEL